MVIRSNLPVLRECGDCTACCTQLPIPAKVVSAEAKPAGKPCPHLCEAGCGIYSRRPAICSRFRCAWLADGDWPSDWRPDQSGLLCLRETLADGFPAALVMETRAGAFLAPQAEAILLALLQNTRRVVVVDPAGKRHLMHGASHRDATAKSAAASLTAAA